MQKNDPPTMKEIVKNHYYLFSLILVKYFSMLSMVASSFP